MNRFAAGTWLDTITLQNDLAGKPLDNLRGSIYDLPEDKRHYLYAPRDPRPPEAMIGELLALTARRSAGK